MPNITYDATSGAMISTLEDGTVNIYTSGDMAWILAASALVMIMIPGLGFFYSGLNRRRNAVNMLFYSLMALAIGSVQWVFWGYSLTFSLTAGPFIGNLANFGFIDILDQPWAPSNNKIPILLYAIYQGMFACAAVAIALGAASERGRPAAFMVFTFCWLTVVYCPIACWTWNFNGWLFNLPSLDFAGGSPVHISSGTAALVISIFLGKRRGLATGSTNYKPHDVSYVVLGTVMLWFGWFGFNGGSELGMNLRSIQAAIVTNTAASMGGITWCTLDWIRTRRWSVVGFCSGAISGLVAITPASGYVGTPAALAFGVVAGIGCNYATALKGLIHVDDAIDIFAAHGIGGMIGNLMTGLFADSRVVSFDGLSVINGGWINHNYVQLGYQLADCCACFAWSFVCSGILLFLINLVPGLKLRATEEEEILGIDETYHGEFACDYVTVDLADDNPQEAEDMARVRSTAHLGKNGGVSDQSSDTSHSNVAGATHDSSMEKSDAAVTKDRVEPTQQAV